MPCLVSLRSQCPPKQSSSVHFLRSNILRYDCAFAAVRLIILPFIGYHLSEYVVLQSSDPLIKCGPRHPLDIVDATARTANTHTSLQSTGCSTHCKRTRACTGTSASAKNRSSSLSGPLRSQITHQPFPCFDCYARHGFPRPDWPASSQVCCARPVHCSDGDDPRDSLPPL